MKRASRQGPGLAGASGGQYWLREWRLASQGAALFPATLKVQSKIGRADPHRHCRQTAGAARQGRLQREEPGQRLLLLLLPTPSLERHHDSRWRDPHRQADKAGLITSGAARYWRSGNRAGTGFRSSLKMAAS